MQYTLRLDTIIHTKELAAIMLLLLILLFGEFYMLYDELRPDMVNYWLNIVKSVNIRPTVFSYVQGNSKLCAPFC